MILGGTASVQAAIDHMRAQVHAARQHVGGALIRWSFYVHPTAAAEILSAIQGAASQGAAEIPGLLVTVPLLRRQGRVLRAGRFLGQPGQVLVGHVRCDIIAVMDGVPIRVRPRCRPQAFTLVDDDTADRIDRTSAVWPGAQP